MAVQPAAEDPPVPEAIEDGSVVLPPRVRQVIRWGLTAEGVWRWRPTSRTKSWRRKSGGGAGAAAGGLDPKWLGTGAWGERVSLR